MEKIRKAMRREDGFTLVELLAVIVILGIIVAIAIPAIGNVIDRADKGATDAEKELVVDAARLYTTVEHKKVKDWGWTGVEVKKFNLTVKVLKEDGYLDSRASNIKDNDYVEITQVEAEGTGAYNYTYEYRPEGYTGG